MGKYKEFDEMVAIRTQNDKMKMQLKELKLQNERLVRKLAGNEEKTFNIPLEVMIGGLKYEVKSAKNLIRDSECAGHGCGNQQLIEIDESISRQLKESTFIHEVLHQFNFVYNIGLEHNQIYQLEAAIYAYIKINGICK